MFKISEEITITLPPGAIEELEKRVKYWESAKGHTADMLPVKVQWFIMYYLDLHWGESVDADLFEE